jgi:dipeptidyl aminopeptidase/acylaminoacyl peptidase
MTASTDTFPLNEHLHADGMPPVPMALAERAGKYTGFTPVEMIAWHPLRRALLVAYRRGTTTQLHLIESPMGTLEQLTDFPDPVNSASFEPKRGDYLVYSRDTGGNEAAQLYRYDLASRHTTLLTDPSQKHGVAVWSHAGDAVAFESMALDKSATGGTRDAVTTELFVTNPLKPKGQRKVATLGGGGWQEFKWSADDRTIYAIEYRSISESAVWAIDVAGGSTQRVLPTPDRRADATRRISYAELNLTRDGKHLVYTSDENGEFQQLMMLELATGARRVLTATIPWDVVAITTQGGAEDDHHELACAIINVAGRHELHAFDLAAGAEVSLLALPGAARSGSISRVKFAKSGDTREIAFTVNSAQSPGDVYSLKLSSDAAEVEQWTRAAIEGIDTSPYREAEIIRWKGFDGLEISGLISRPPSRFTGKRPVLIHIHGGPESQAVIGFLGVNNYFVDELGIAYIQPNVRGSTGYGKTFVTLDDGIKREDSVKDIGALFDWIAMQPDLDASRILVAGRSYGGYMSLAVATTYADRIAASIAIVGISHFTTFLERTESYRRDLRRVEYGDERDPKIRAFFDRIAPLMNAHKVGKPLFVVAGRNDPRVPYQEGEQMVAKVKANGVPVWHIVADNEGHAFARKPNTDYVFYAQVMFVKRFLLDEA